MKVALHLDQDALTGCEQTRTIVREEFGEYPPLDLIVELALMRVDPEDLATAIQATLLGRRTIIPLPGFEDEPPVNLPSRTAPAAAPAPVASPA